MALECLTDRGSHISLSVLVAPRSSKNRVSGILAGKLKIALTAPPVDGAANEALLEFLAKALKLPIRNLSISRGLSAKSKCVEIVGLKVDALEALIKQMLTSKS